MTSGLLSTIVQGLECMIPSFLQTDPSKVTQKPRRKSNTAYLDGMRGVAAFVVYVSHTAERFMPGKGHVYGEGDNLHLLQLPIVRLIYTGLPMVCIFFVISGFALTIKPLRLARDGAKEDLLDHWASAILRRGIRLFMPCLATTLVVMVLVILGVQDYAGYHDLPGLKDREPVRYASWTHHFVDWLRFIASDLTNWWNPTTAKLLYDTHLWTIPLEFQTSMIIFITAIALGGMDIMITDMLLLGLFVYFQCIDMWYVSLFAAGMGLAAHPKPWTSSSRWRQTFWAVTCIISLFLLSFPTKQPQLTPGYVWLSYLTRNKWKWYSYGAALLMYSTREVPILQKPFTTSTSIYLGRISYALYLVHGPFLHSVGFGTIAALQWSFQKWTSWHYEIGSVIGLLLLTSLVISTSDMFCRLVDEPCVRLARRVGDRLRKRKRQYALPRNVGPYFPTYIYPLPEHQLKLGHRLLCARF